MIPQSGSFRLFRLVGIEVFLHWSWFVVAIRVASSSLRPSNCFSLNLASSNLGLNSGFFIEIDFRGFPFFAASRQFTQLFIG